MNKNIVGLVALFLGGIGIHKFLLGKPVQGMLYLIFCLTYIPMIIAFFEAMVYFFSSQEAFDKAYFPKK